MAQSTIKKYNPVDWIVLEYQDKYVSDTSETINYDSTTGTFSNSSTNTSMSFPGVVGYVPVGVVGSRFLNESVSGTSGSGGTYCYMITQYVDASHKIHWRAYHIQAPTNVSVLLYILMVKEGMVTE